MNSRKWDRLCVGRWQTFSAALLAFGAFGLVGASDTSAQMPQLFFDTEITSVSLSGGTYTFTLPLGENFSPVDTTISTTKAQDHNSSRSNKTASISPGDPDNPDPINPREYHGSVFRMDSFFDVFFDLSFDSPLKAPQYGGADPLVLGMQDAARLTREPSSSHTFDAYAPAFNMLSSSDFSLRALDHRGHVTVLKISTGGDVDQDGLNEEISIASDGFLLTTIPGSDIYSALPDGSLEHTFQVSLTVTATLDTSSSSLPFNFGPLTGTITEVGRLSNAIVPEPGSLALFATSGIAACMRRRRR